MQKSDLRDFDLNLLVALEALLEEKNVTRAAERLGLSQPAMSRALGRLRKGLGDPLLVRVPDGLAPTERAIALREPLARALDEVRAVLKTPEFDPATATNRFRILAHDYTALVTLPEVLKDILEEAPGVEVDIGRIDGNSWSALASGGADLMVGRLPREAGSGFYAQALFDDPYVCVVRRGHPILKKDMTVERFCEWPHGVIDIRGGVGWDIDEELSRLGVEREIALTTPHFTAAMYMVGKTDLIQTVPRRLAEMHAKTAGLIIRDMPIDMEPIRIGHIWHERQHNDQAHKWLRGKVRTAAAER